MIYRLRKWSFLMLLLLVAGAAVHAQNVDFKATAPEAVVMGEQFRVAFTVNAEARDFRGPEFPDFDVLMGPSQSTSVSSRFVNGQSSSETIVTFTYVLMPKKEGTFNIASATVRAKNANYTSNALVIKVLPPDKANEAAAAAGQSGGASSTSSAGEHFIRMQLSKNSVYEQEPILVSFKIYSTNSLTGLSNVKFPEFEGFLVQDIEIPEIQVKLENYQGKNYQTYLIKQALLYPQRTGKITIDKGEYDIQVRVRTQERVSSFFDDFFDSYRNVTRRLTSSPATVDVKPLPSGKPASFSGAVGEFQMTGSINTTNLKANEAVTISVKISGTGNVRLIKNPEVTFPNDFEVYDPKVDLSTRNTTAGVTGSKTIEYMAIPRYGGDFEIPAIQFSYFDPKAGTYKTLSSESYKLHVEAGEGGEAGTGPVVSNFTNRESVRYLGQDIRFLKVKGLSFVSKDKIFFGSLGYYLCYLIPLFLFVLFFIIYRKKIKENANIALVRTKKANKTAVRRLKVAGKLLKENNKEAFYDEVLRALWGYLSDKLSIPQASLTKDNVEIELAKYGVGEELTKEFIDILNTCEFARYAPSQASDAMDKLYEQTVDAIGKMENTIKK